MKARQDRPPLLNVEASKLLSDKKYLLRVDVFLKDKYAVVTGDTYHKKEAIKSVAKSLNLDCTFNHEVKAWIVKFKDEEELMSYLSELSKEVSSDTKLEIL